ncbi:pheromone A receptor-domain-containing protein [Russula dissimulans]|nr:pheromone A receptor-domain-containing protein [Russula dissimulans]
MGVELPIFSFLSVSLLVLILPAQVHCLSIPSASMFAWLFICNLIHGINTVLWLGNRAEHTPLWCDISSVVLLGAMAALPACFLCIARRLEAMTSSRNVEQNQTKTYGAAFEYVTCFLLPVLYLGLHTIVQDHRFVIIEGFGCQAAVHNSLPGLIIVWFPPLCVSIIGVFFCLSAAINIGKNHYNSRCHFPSAPEMTLSPFIRHIIFATSGMLYIIVVYVYALSSITSSGLLPWTSVSQTRSQVSQVEVVPLHSQMGVQTKLIWWFIPVWSLLLFVLAILGEENQIGYCTTLSWLSRRLKGDLLPIHIKSSSKTANVPVHLLRSGWDDDLDLRSPVGSLRSKRFSFFKKTESTRTSTPSPPPPEDEVVFAQSTHTYLASIAAQQLHLPPPPPAVRLHSHPSLAFAPKQPQDTNPTTPMEVDPIIPASPNSDAFPKDTWPEPPVTPPFSVSPQYLDPRPSSPVSTRSSIGSTIVDALGAIPTHLRDAPFYVNGPSVTALPTAQGTRGPMQHRPSMRRGPKRNDVIYMTVVHETVDGP